MRGRQSGRLAALAFCLSLAASPAAAVEGEEVGYETPDGFQISSLYFRPEGPPSGAILLAPDPDEGKDAWAAVADSLARSGWAVLVPDLRGTGGSQWQRGLQRNRAGFTARERAATGMDSHSALRYLRERIGRASDRLVWIASGAAFEFGPEAMGDLPGPSAAVLLSPRGETGSPAAVGGGWLGVRPILCVVGRDDLVGIETAALLVRERPATECWIVEARGRGAALFRSREDLIRSMRDWIESHAAAPERGP